MRNRTPRHLLGLVLTVPLLLVSTQAAQGQKKPKGGDRRGPVVAVQVETMFSVHEREQVAAFFSEHRPEDLKPLPPGIRKKLARGKPMPPGIAKKALPQDLLGALPVRPGHEVVRVGLDVVLVELATGVIRDVLMDVIR